MKLHKKKLLQRATTESGTISITDSNGGAETTTSNDGTTTLTYDSKETGAKDATAYDIKTNVDVELSAPYVKVDMGLEAGQTKEREDTTKDHTGTDTTRIDTETKSNSSSWNHSQTASQTKTDSTSASVSSALKYALRTNMATLRHAVRKGLWIIPAEQSQRIVIQLGLPIR